jgi:hypothetical protein
MRSLPWIVNADAAAGLGAAAFSGRSMSESLKSRARPAWYFW